MTETVHCCYTTANIYEIFDEDLLPYDLSNIKSYADGDIKQFMDDDYIRFIHWKCPFKTKAKKLNDCSLYKKHCEVPLMLIEKYLVYDKKLFLARLNEPFIILNRIMDNKYLLSPLNSTMLSRDYVDDKLQILQLVCFKCKKEYQLIKDNLY